ncbi:Pentatricopeptide repeat-containing protein [Platanthera zijinensis]|uniref:Pentatricopeptide repeat-containing protein n=1 Tax=Platanthera zijinensis TaxID=2320716 RepID=A0AAP0C0M9_9ASPA
MYCKCGSIDDAVEAFEAASVKSLSSWNSMILGFATHGREKEAFQLFDSLRNYNHSGLRPDNVSFINILTACSHSGMVEEAFSYFKSMKKEHCLVDTLGRARFIEKAKNLVERMSAEPDGIIWGSLLSAAQLMVLDQGRSGRHFILSNTLARERDFSGSAAARGRMREMGVRKEMCCNMIEMDGVVNEFVASGVMHDRA